MIDARALFEKSALSIPAEKSRPLWDAWARYEYMYGDLAAVNKLEARFKEVFSNGMSPLSHQHHHRPVSGGGLANR